MRSRPWCTLDTETTGLGEDREPVEIAVVGEAGHSSFHCLLRPERPSCREAYGVHGLGEEELIGAPTFFEAWPRLAPHLVGRRIFCYGASFDRRTLTLAHQRCRASLRCRGRGRGAGDAAESLEPSTRFPPLPSASSWICVLDGYHHLRGHRPSLRIACEIEGVAVPPGPHRAPTDALLLWHLLMHLPALLDL